MTTCIDSKDINIEFIKNYKTLHDQIDELTGLHEDLCMKKYGVPNIPRNSSEWSQITKALIEEYEEECAKFYGKYTEEFIKESEMEI